EVFGERTFQTDVFLRTLDFAGYAERSLAFLSAKVRATLEAYARGVNAYLTRERRWFEPRFPPEFLLLWYTPEPSTARDSLLVLKIMALQLSTNLNHELTRLEYAAAGLTSADIEDLLPSDPADHAPPLPELGQLYPLRGSPEGRRARLELEPLLEGAASNNWVVGGAKTRSGQPLLANDPHLRLSAPSIWYLAHL